MTPVDLSVGPGWNGDQGGTVTRVEPVRSHATFTSFRSMGVRGRCGSIGVRFVADDADSEVRVAYAVGKKLGGAVIRNRLRRRLRAIMFERAALLPSGAYLVNAGAGATLLSFEDLTSAMDQALGAATGLRRISAGEHEEN